MTAISWTTRIRHDSDATLTGWDTEIEAGSVLVVHLNSISNFKQLFVQLHIKEIEE